MITVLGLCVLGAGYWLYKTRLAPEVQFTTQKWLAYEDWQAGRRTAIVDDLLRDHHLKGMTVAQIDTLLGKTDDMSSDPNGDRVYSLGPERGWLSIDFERLILHFKGGRVSSYEMNTD
jgi:hypothetical protein